MNARQCKKWIKKTGIAAYFEHAEAAVSRSMGVPVGSFRFTMPRKVAQKLAKKRKR